MIPYVVYFKYYHAIKITHKLHQIAFIWVEFVKFVNSPSL